MMSAVDRDKEYYREMFFRTVKELAPANRSNKNLVELYERLRDHAEMKVVWDALFNWRFPEVSDYAYVCTLIPYEVARFAENYVHGTLPASAMIPSERRDRAERIAKCSKIIVREMKALRLPSPVYRYVPFDITELHVRDILDHFGHGKDCEKMIVYEDQGEEEPEEMRALDHCVDCLFWSGHAEKIDSTLSVYDVLESLTDPAHLEAMAPVGQVLRSRTEMVRRRAIIRDFADWLWLHFGIARENAIKVIHSFAVVVLNDDDITRHYVKDALKESK